jgi:hypothetical protein
MMWSFFSVRPKKVTEFCYLKKKVTTSLCTIYNLEVFILQPMKISHISRFVYGSYN